MDNFDLARLNFVGWLLFSVSVAVFVCGIVVIVGTPLDPSNGHGLIHEIKSHAVGYGIIATAALVFVGLRLLLARLGVSVFRKSREDSWWRVSQ